MPTTNDLEGWAHRLAILLDNIDPDATDAAVAEALDLAAGEYDAAVHDKVDALVHVLHAIEDRHATAKRDERRAKAAAQYQERQKRRVRSLLTRLMAAHEGLTGERKVTTLYATVSVRDHVQYTYPASTDDWPVDLLSEVTTVKPDREAARARIDAGQTLPSGFGVEKIPTIQVRGR